MPISEDFAKRLLPLLPGIVAEYGTPFHIYDAQGIVRTHRAMEQEFGDLPFRQYFAVKALPNPAVLFLLLREGSGLDCSSHIELLLADRVGARGEDIVFTSNNTSMTEYTQAVEAGALVTFDDRTMLDKVDTLPDVVAFRVSPHGLPASSRLMGDAVHSKFGVPVDEIVDAYRDARRRGATSFGIHGMSCANELDTGRAIRAAVDLLELGGRVSAEAGADLVYVNVGGGLGVPCQPTDEPFDFRAYAAAIVAARALVFGAGGPRILMECGRFVTGPHGVLVTRVINRCSKGREVIGLDASMSALMRPAIYGAYHHISLPFAGGRRLATFDVVGSLCENMDKFAVDRLLPEPREGDVVLIHDTGAHGHSMGFTYNGRLRPAEFLLTTADEVVRIRRPETFDDYVGTVCWWPEPAPAGRAVAEV